ncbi:hypothetical protein BDR05DRAFT_997344 [Suillus weaverae]|nr:hypothetical protein BDR05DRAFT_997344 [Suillus weaverae]
MKKRKNHTSGDSTAAIKSKKAKATPPDGSGDRPSSEDITPPPQLVPVPVVHRAIVWTEKEEAALYDDVDDDNDAERRSSSPDVESVADELKWLMKEWTSPVYAFFNPMPRIIENDGRWAHEFKCSARGCKTTI